MSALWGEREPPPPESAPVLELATDADYLFFANESGFDVNLARAHVQGLVNLAEGFYRPTRLTFRITFQSVWSTNVPVSGAYPYASRNVHELLSSFENYWSTQWPRIPRDAAHLFYGGQPTDHGGVARMRTVCRPDAYGVSSVRVGLRERHASARRVAHEIGHNLGAPHDDEVVPPTADCVGDPRLMCSSNGKFEFSRGSLRAMTPYLQLPCLHAANPLDLLSIDPARRELRVPINRLETLTSAFTVQNQDAGPVTIHRLWFEDAQGYEDTSGEWLVPGWAPAAAVPFELVSGASFAIDIAIHLSQLGVPTTRYLAIEASADGIPPWRTRVAVEGMAVAPILNIMPSAALEFSAAGTVRSVIVENAGYSDLNRTRLILEGDHPEYFEIESSRCVSGPFSVPPSVCTLSPADTEQVRIRYRMLPAPWAPLLPPHTARLRIVTDVGERLLPLRGTYVAPALSRIPSQVP